MAQIQQIDRRSVHHLQSGQVINEGLTSAVKELVENSLDAHATSIEIRFRNYGLDSIEVIDNGDGVPPDSYETIALKHYTSKLKDYSDLDSVSTFGFRGEALSSLCALSDVTITTARDCDAPKGVKLVFESSGKLKSQTVVAAAKGTAVCSLNLFKTLPVRRKEMERNIKREYTKVLGILQAYASVCVGVKFSIFNQPSKGKKTPVFATKGNPTTRENISNVFGSKSLAALLPLELEFELTPTLKGALAKGRSKESRMVKIVGHISRPVVGEGRNAPDRQMFFVNGRPCVLPQIAKAINEVYKGFNVTQSPFIFADIQLDTDAYDVNVSPDKRTILLHDQADLLENLKSSLGELFEQHEQTVPVNRIQSIQQKLPSYKQTSLPPLSSSSLDRPAPTLKEPKSTPARTPVVKVDEDGEPPEEVSEAPSSSISSFAREAPNSCQSTPRSSARNTRLHFKPPTRTHSPPVEDYDSPGPEQHHEVSHEFDEEEPIPSSQIPQSQRPPTQRSPRKSNAQATIIIGDRSPVISNSPLKLQYSPPSKRRKVDDDREVVARPKRFANALNKFRAPGTQPVMVEEGDVQDDEGEDEFEARHEQTDHDMEGSGDEEVDPEVQPPQRQETEEPEERLLFHKPTQIEISDEDEQPAEPQSMPPRPEPIEVEDNEEDNDTYISPLQAAAAAQARAAQRLAEAEAIEAQSAAAPSEDILRRSARILRGNPETCTNSLIRPISISLDSIRSLASTLHRTSQPPLPSTSTAPPSCSPPSAADSDSALAEKHLTLTISKHDFLRMSIIGQFNLGFILTTRNQNLFIIDQHASDEKFNFETLQHTTVVQSQPLVHPRILPLMAMDELTVIEHLDVFRRNGFGIQVDEEETMGRRCKLVSLPMSKETVFGVEDLEEIIHLIHENGNGAMMGDAGVRPKKVRSMFAMRACRKSIMVGKALTKGQMERVVRNMGALEKPWNCPHGRPTMRHLAELGGVGGWREYERGGEEEGGEGGGSGLSDFGAGRLDWGGENWEVAKELAYMVSEEEEEGEVGEDTGDTEVNG